ncbi:MAG: GxxExxY protein [Dehalococcoidia bacterium]
MSATVEDEGAAAAVIGAAIEVHRALGPGFLESVYEEALATEFRLREIPFIRQPVVEIGFKGHRVGEQRLDFLVCGCLIVELKAVESLAPIHTAQVVSYLRATNLRLGMLLNFNVSKMTAGIRRVIST